MLIFAIHFHTLLVIELYQLALPVITAIWIAITFESGYIIGL